MIKLASVAILHLSGFQNIFFFFFSFSYHNAFEIDPISKYVFVKSCLCKTPSFQLKCLHVDKDYNIIRVVGFYFCLGGRSDMKPADQKRTRSSLVYCA